MPETTKVFRSVGFFLLISGYLFFLGRIGLPLAHDFSDPLCMRDTSLVVSALLDRGTSFTVLTMEAMKHLEGVTQFVLMSLYCMGIGDGFPLTPATMQFPNTVVGIVACVFTFLLIRRLIDSRTAYFTTIAFLLTPWIATVIRLSWYFNMLALLLQFSTAYFLTRLMNEPASRLWRIMVPVSLSVYLFSSLEWPSYFLFVALFCMLSGNLAQMVRNRYNVLLVTSFAALLAWDIALCVKFGMEGLINTRLLYAFTASYRSISIGGSEGFWNNVILGWGPLMAFALGGAAFYLLKWRKSLSMPRITRGFMDACGLWLVWATGIILLGIGHRTYLYVLGMPAAVFSGLVLSKVPFRPVVAIIAALGVFQVGVITEWGFGLNSDGRRRVLAAACFLIDNRPDLLSSDKTLVAVDCRIAGGKGLGAAVAQYSRPQKEAVVIRHFLPVPGRPSRPPGSETSIVDDIIDGYERTGLLETNGLIVESNALAETNPASKFWVRVMNDPSIRWIAVFRENGGDIFVGEVAPGKAVPLKDAPVMDVKTLSDRYLEKYDRSSFLKTNLEHTRIYATKKLSK